MSSNLKDVLERIKNYKTDGDSPSTDPGTYLKDKHPHLPTPRRSTHTDLPFKELVPRLQTAAAAYHRPSPFKVNDIVRGKPEVGRGYRSWEQPHIILEVFEEPFRPTVDAAESAMNCAGFQFHGTIGQIDKEGDMSVYLIDFRLWELHPEWKP